MASDLVKSKHSSAGFESKLANNFYNMLTDKASGYVRNWLVVETRKQYVSLVLSFLRGYYSVSRVGGLTVKKQKSCSVPRELDRANLRDFYVAHQAASPSGRKRLLLKGNEEMVYTANYVP